MKNVGPVFLILLGLMQVAGDLSNLPTLKGLGLAAAASPAPKVFSAVRGLETYSTRFYIEWIGTDSQFHSIEITPNLYSHLHGPYNRRNVYGAVLAYGPVLMNDPRSQGMFKSVADYGFCGTAPLLRELGIEASVIFGRTRIRLEPRPGSNIDGLPLIIELPCV
jgi:hypothetical protein